MKLKIDRQADALYLTLGDATSTRSEEVAPESLYLSKRAPDLDTQRILLETVLEVSRP